MAPSSGQAHVDVAPGGQADASGVVPTFQQLSWSPLQVPRKGLGAQVQTDLPVSTDMVLLRQNGRHLDIAVNRALLALKLVVLQGIDELRLTRSVQDNRVLKVWLAASHFLLGVGPWIFGLANAPYLDPWN